jgi:copper(I)-binding protein
MHLFSVLIYGAFPLISIPHQKAVALQRDGVAVMFLELDNRANAAEQVRARWRTITIQ